MGTSSGNITALLAGGPAIDSHLPWVDVRDVARAIVLALDAPVGSRFALTSGVVPHRQLATMIDELTGRAPRRMFFGASSVRRLARVNDLAGGRIVPMLPERGSLDFLLDSTPEVDTTRATRDLGLSFRPIRETLADTIRWWSEHDSIDRRLAGRLAPKPV
jgi:nucleoside-diphosphate-sugar epimerase